ncbi:glycoside hydrolase family 72 protein [Daldinia caldariorum]|uniref:glycoside hydrolase family 72 protein n=1 Tax=Daldinia caldariorum TaxID=326644 RepID=UPI002007868F|nr:glycoside hydrolase family 72 protein [Daldinia caldariorum]KAI1471268.1 glycoside hydrolase family 72 protein [Daldinia caldariorum]
MSHSIVPIPITIQGRYFWRGIERFLINGVAYHFHETNSVSCSDALVDDRIHELERILPLLKDLKINTLFISHIDETKSHSACMNLLARHGIYVLASIESICYPLSNQGALRPYTSNFMQRLFQVVEKLAHYPNLLGFAISTDLITSETEEATEPFVRAVVRDVRQYLTLLAAKRHQRVVPVGVISPADTRSSVKKQHSYFCSGADNESIEFFIFYNFFWAGEFTMQASGYSELVHMFSSTHIPVSFVYGNNSITPRAFWETYATYSDPGMLRVFSGGIVHEFFDAINHYGLVRRSTLLEDNTPRYRKTKDFRNLCDKLKKSFQSLPTSMLVRSRPVEAAAMSGTKPNPPHPGWNQRPVGSVPRSRVNWAEIETQITDDSEWVDAGKEWVDLTVEDLADSMWDKLNIDGIGP